MHPDGIDLCFDLWSGKPHVLIKPDELALPDKPILANQILCILVGQRFFN